MTRNSSRRFIWVGMRTLGKARWNRKFGWDLTAIEPSFKSGLYWIHLLCESFSQTTENGVSIGLTSREKVPLCLRRRDWHFLADCWIHIRWKVEKSCQLKPCWCTVLKWRNFLQHSLRNRKFFQHHLMLFQSSCKVLFPPSMLERNDFTVEKFPLFSLVNFKAWWFSRKTKLRYL